MDFAPEDLALATVPGADFDPKERSFDVEELRPQPIIRLVFLLITMNRSIFLIPILAGYGQFFLGCSFNVSMSKRVGDLIEDYQTQKVRKISATS